MYREQRNYENLQIRRFQGTGEFEVPALRRFPPAQLPKRWTAFSEAVGDEYPAGTGIHFFLDDYRFIRCWTYPDRYTEMLSRFQAVASPDFSIYTDFPKAAQVWNHYRKHWLGRYWQENGIPVIPTISWAGHDSYSWCFDGEPVDSAVIVSSVGTQADTESRHLFLDGYFEMMDRLRPAAVVFYGTVPSACRGNILPVKSFQSRFRNMHQPARRKDGTPVQIRTGGRRLPVYK